VIIKTPYVMQAEWIDLLEEDRSGRVRWDNPAMCTKLKFSNSAVKRRPPTIGRDALHGESAPTGHSLPNPHHQMNCSVKS
jgi:hypothetical protein